ncbi:uncharacterized protein SPPG_00914 [Spizellomyces punctatus DAOM BR117]|uniref:B box-type domain-containing protein n=1 Tax=Spizellomyces punctatus (strain DAOM BR117) TaxID=645134 RepID=A0A0L0HRC4_SPIPD|nr:uncharacterized protein SPPG_00914 [Spizellomyces punctatus DAOM BR117]KND03429.1 hypothetical protein SPPG_00914 [Spizellomyces punctatus DAOM BR117]|eukprot:XP_016611468.1 hypothetical protein SPPG_00914 [Spizellomyces punctatus DAOM BR117]
MCPSCSKVGCEACVKKWLTEEKSQCPHCRAPMIGSQLVQCRFIDDIVNHLRKAASDRAKHKDDLCLLHSAQLYYYCHDCREAICPDCAVIEAKHKEHKFEHLHVVYKTHRASVTAKTITLYEKIDDYRNLIRKVDGRISALKTAQRKLDNQHRDLLRNAQRRLDEQIDSRMALLTAHKERLTTETDLLGTTLETVHSHLLESSYSDLIKSSDDIIYMMKTQHPENPQEYTLPEVSCEFESDLVPNYDMGVFRIDKFRERQQSEDAVYSEPILVSGLMWRLKVYPSGNGKSQGLFLSVFVELVSGYPARSKYQYRVELVKHGSNTLSLNREFSSDFTPGECWGYNHFCRLDLLERDGYWDPNDDVLEFRYHVRAPTYAQKCRDLSHYIAVHIGDDVRPTLSDLTTNETNVRAVDEKKESASPNLELQGQQNSTSPSMSLPRTSINSSWSRSRTESRESYASRFDTDMEDAPSPPVRSRLFSRGDSPEDMLSFTTGRSISPMDYNSHPIPNRAITPPSPSDLRSSRNLSPPLSSPGDTPTTFSRSLLNENGQSRWPTRYEAWSRAYAEVMAQSEHSFFRNDTSRTARAAEADHHDNSGSHQHTADCCELDTNVSTSRWRPSSMSRDTSPAISNGKWNVDLPSQPHTPQSCRYRQSIEQQLDALRWRVRPAGSPPPRYGEDTTSSWRTEDGRHRSAPFGRTVDAEASSVRQRQPYKDPERLKMDERSSLANRHTALTSLTNLRSDMHEFETFVDSVTKEVRDFENLVETSARTDGPVSTNRPCSPENETSIPPSSSSSLVATGRQNTVSPALTAVDGETPATMTQRIYTSRLRRNSIPPGLKTLMETDTTVGSRLSVIPPTALALSSSPFTFSRTLNAADTITRDKQGRDWELWKPGEGLGVELCSDRAPPQMHHMEMYRRREVDAAGYGRSESSPILAKPASSEATVSSSCSFSSEASFGEVVERSSSRAPLEQGNGKGKGKVGSELSID